MAAGPKNKSMASLTAVRFSRCVLLARGSEGVAQSVHFYQNALGLTVLRHTDDWAEIICGAVGSASGDIGRTPPNPQQSQQTVEEDPTLFRLNIRAVESEAQLSVGYGPILTFDVDDMDSVVARCAQFGGKLDGPIQYPAHGKVAALRAPDGCMIGLYEPTL